VTRRSRARKGEGDRLHDEILDAAQELLVERGSVNAVSMRAVADRVGVTPPSIYLHFSDKDELIFECCRRGFTALMARMAEARGRGGTVVEQLRRMGRAYVEYGLENGSGYRVIFSAGLPESVSADDPGGLPGIQAFEMLVDTVSVGITSGELRQDLDPVALAVAVWAIVHGAVMIALVGQGERLPLPAPDDLLEAVLAVAEAGFRAA
jgi:AcrR family transcriptional regulator